MVEEIYLKKWRVKIEVYVSDIIVVIGEVVVVVMLSMFK